MKDQRSFSTVPSPSYKLVLGRGPTARGKKGSRSPVSLPGGLAHAGNQKTTNAQNLFNLLGCHFWGLATDGPNPQENITLFCRKNHVLGSKCPVLRRPLRGKWAPPSPLLVPFALVVAEVRWLLLSPVSEHHSCWGWTTLT